MKLLLVWPSAEFSTYDVAVGIRAGLVALGHEVVDYRLYQRLQLMHSTFAAITPSGRVPNPEMVCLHAAEGLPYKAIVEGTPWALVVSGMSLHPNAVWALRRIGVKVAVWFTETPYEPREHYLARFSDLAFVSERSEIGVFQRILDEHTGGRAVYLPHAFNPAAHRPSDSEKPSEKCDVVLVGTGFLERQWLLENIDWAGIDLCLGGLWLGIEQLSFLAQYVRYPCLANGDTIRLYHRAKIVLNPHRWSLTAESLNPRAYEAAACGAFQIMSYRVEAEEVFGDSVALYSPGVPWRLEALIRKYLADDSCREAMAMEARARVQRHTFEARAKTIVENMEV